MGLDFGFDNFSFDNMFGANNGYATDGQIGVNQRANDSFLGFDQSKISSSIFDVMSSLGTTAVNAAGAAAGKAIGDAINPSQNQTGVLQSFFKTFSSTPTGQQVQQAAIVGNVQSFMQSPTVWFFGVLGIGAMAWLAFRR